MRKLSKLEDAILAVTERFPARVVRIKTSRRAVVYTEDMTFYIDRNGKMRVATHFQLPVEIVHQRGRHVLRARALMMREDARPAPPRPRRRNTLGRFVRNNARPWREEGLPKGRLPMLVQLKTAQDHAWQPI